MSEPLYVGYQRLLVRRHKIFRGRYSNAVPHGVQPIWGTPLPPIKYLEGRRSPAFTTHNTSNYIPSPQIQGRSSSPIKRLWRLTRKPRDRASFPANKLCLYGGLSRHLKPDPLTLHLSHRGGRSPIQNAYFDWLVIGSRQRIAFNIQIVLNLAGFSGYLTRSPNSTTSVKCRGLVAKIDMSHRFSGCKYILIVRYWRAHTT